MTDFSGNWRRITGTALLSGALAIGLWGLLSPQVAADREQGERRGHGKRAAVPALYTQECGSCHLAYPAYLLPATAWRSIMDNLDRHFGDNAELTPEQQQPLRDYLEQQAADNGDYQHRRYSPATGTGDAVLRITRQPFFLREHREIPATLVTNSSDIGSFSQCERCHRQAEQGNFDEEQIHIPGYGRWDD